jgi:hypothetical protein
MGYCNGLRPYRTSHSKGRTHPQAGRWPTVRAGTVKEQHRRVSLLLDSLLTFSTWLGQTSFRHPILLYYVPFRSNELTHGCPQIPSRMEPGHGPPPWPIQNLRFLMILNRSRHRAYFSCRHARPDGFLCLSTVSGHTPASLPGILWLRSTLIVCA